jgi:predicted HAD superfamily hydrolase
MGTRQRGTTFAKFISYCKEGRIKSIDVVSFDLFDTVFIRGVSEPKDIFWLQGTYLSTSGLISAQPEEWVEIRMVAERDSRSGQPFFETTLKRIYDFIPDSVFINNEHRKVAIHKEIELENKYIQAVPSIIEVIQFIRSKGATICFTTDMYLPQETLREFIDSKLQLNFHYDLFVSNSHFKNKHFGELYNVIKSHYQTHVGAKFYHIGDSLHADVEMALKSKWRGVWFDGSLTNRYDTRLKSTFKQKDLLTSLINGASKAARATFCSTSNDERVIHEIGASVAGPLLFGFVFWVLKSAQINKINKLYFLARDGQILKKVADQICEKYNINVENKYLYVSRQALHPASVEEVNEEVLDWMFDATHHLSVKTIFKRVNCKPDEFNSNLTNNGFPSESWNRNLREAERAKLRHLIESEGTIQRTILFKSKKARFTLLKYLEQEGAIGDDWAIVDIGWNGRLQRSLSRALSLEGMRTNPIVGYYFNLLNRYKAFEDDVLNSYVQENGKDNLHFHTGIIEVFVSADHGSTIGYKLTGKGKVEPHLQFPENSLAIRWGLNILQNGVLNYVSCLINNLDGSFDAIDYFKVSYKRYETFHLSPTKQEAITFGNFMFSEQQTDDTFHAFASNYSFIDAIKLRLFKEKKFHAEWNEGVLARANSISRFLLTNSSYPYQLFLRLIKTFAN